VGLLLVAGVTGCDFSSTVVADEPGDGGNSVGDASVVDGRSSTAEASSADAVGATNDALSPDGGVDASPAEAGASLDATVDADAGASPDGATDDAGCVPDVICTTNPGAPCVLGHTSCAAGQVTCVDNGLAPDGTGCGAGTCTHGACLAPLTLHAGTDDCPAGGSGCTDLSRTSLTPGRVCTSEAPHFALTALTGLTATLDEAPTDDCLAAGDEVLIINLQGAPGATDNVGNWELLHVASLAGSVVTFATAKTKHYGVAADDAVGTGPTDPKVELVRVPSFGALTVASDAQLITSAFDGATGGVLALRAATLSVAGTISVAGLGYRNGRWSDDTAACSDSVATESGESIGGPPVQSTASSFGGPGGISTPTGLLSFISNPPLCPGAGHSGPGQAGLSDNDAVRTVGAPGGAYGVDDATKLTLGSGASGNLTCENGFPGPALKVVHQLLAGGVVAIFTDSLEVLPAGTITASALPSSRDVSAAGGYVFLSGRVLDLGTDLVTALGGIGIASATTLAGHTAASSDGYVVLQGASVTGTTSPAAHLR
jgi:hypothetical protein